MPGSSIGQLSLSSSLVAAFLIPVEHGGTTNYHISAGMLQPAGAYLTTAALSNHSHGNPTLALTNLSGTTASNSAGLTLSLSAGNYITTARASNDAVGLNTALTAGPLAWTVNSSGISLNAGSAAGTTSGFAGNSISGSITHNTAGINISLSHPAWLTTAAQSNHSHGNPTLNLTNMSGTTASASNGLTLSLFGAVGSGVTTAGANVGISGTLSTNGLSLSVTAPAQTNQTLSLVATGNTTQNTTMTVDARSVTFNGAGNVSVGYSNGSVVISGGTAAASPVAISAGTSSASLASIVLSNSNAVSFGLNGSTITASIPASSSLSGTGLVSISANGSTISIGVPGNTQSYFAIPGPWAGATATTNWFQSTSAIAPFAPQQPLSVGTALMMVSGSLAASSTQATTGGTSLSAGATTTVNMVIYSRGVGASSMSLQSVTSTQVINRQAITLSINANSSQHSFSNRVTYGTYSGTFDYSTSVTRIDYHTSNLTGLSGVKQMHVPLGISLSPGQYWLGIGGSTSTATQNGSVSVMTRMLLSFTSIGITQNTRAAGQFGGGTNSSVMWQPAAGSFSVGGAGGTTASIDMANISSNVSNFIPYIQLIRIG